MKYVGKVNLCIPYPLHEAVMSSVEQPKDAHKMGTWIRDY